MSENGRKPVKKISASAAVLLTLKVEVQSPYNRITISYNRKGHRAFAVFLLSIFVGKCRRAVSDMRCRSPPLHLDFTFQKFGLEDNTVKYAPRKVTTASQSKSRPLSATYWTEYEKRQVHRNLSLCMC